MEHQKNMRYNNNKYIIKAKEIHGDKYDYSKVEYINNHSKVCIICPIHGEFWQNASSHLKGCGCPKCSAIVRGKKNKKIRYSYFINDEVGESQTKAYHSWDAMLKRCYSGKHKTYSDCSVCEEWYLFSNFKKWFNENYIEGYDLDKDILVKGNKVYSPETCCFVPREINEIISNNKSIRGKYPMGVYKNPYDKYCASLKKYKKIIRIGVFDTPSEAFMAYKKAKEEHIKNVAKNYYDENKISLKVYESLCKYEIHEND